MRLIDADELGKCMCGICNADYSDEPCEPTDCVFRNAVKNAPTIDAVQVVHGRWEDRYGGRYANPVYDCSVCKNAALGKLKRDELGTTRFVQELSAMCPHCGTEME